MKNGRLILRGEAALLLAIMINSIGVLLMLQSGSGISAISSVPYAFSEVFPKLTLGTLIYIFQGLLVACFSPPIKVGVISQMIYIVNKERCICYARYTRG